MLFRDLMSLPFNRASDRIGLSALREAGIVAPDDVLEQFYGDHGRKDEFQSEYGALNISRLLWSEAELPAHEIVACSVYPSFRRWVDDVADRLDHFGADGWGCIDIRPDVVEHWRTRLTWQRSPILIPGELVDEPQPLRLVEGHTRLGVLTGLLRIGQLTGGSVHKVWLASLPKLG